MMAKRKAHQKLGTQTYEKEVMAKQKANQAKLIKLGKQA